MQRELARTEAGTWRRLSSRRAVLLLLGVLLLSGGTVVFAASLLVTPGPVPGIPGELADLPLSHRLDGAEAAREVDRPHRKTIRVRAATVAHYERPGSVAMLYVSDAYLGFLAERQLQAMTGGMKKGESPFAPPESFSRPDRESSGLWVRARSTSITGREAKSSGSRLMSLSPSRLSPPPSARSDSKPPGAIEPK